MEQACDVGDQLWQCSRGVDITRKIKRGSKRWCKIGILDTHMKYRTQHDVKTATSSAKSCKEQVATPDSQQHDPLRA